MPEINSIILAWLVTLVAVQVLLIFLSHLHCFGGHFPAEPGLSSGPDPLPPH